MLCSVARAIVEPATVTGSNSATGVSTPVRPTWDANLAQDGLFFLGRELKGNGPAWCAGGKAQVELLLEAVDLYDHAVDVVVQVTAVLERLGTELVDLGRRGAACHVGVDAKSGATQPVQKLALAVDVQRISIGDGVDKGGQIATRP